MQDVLMRLGQEVASDQTCHDMMRQGRPLTNFEMMAYRLWHQSNLDERYKRLGHCCDEPLNMDGRCVYGRGPEGHTCVLVRKAKRILGRNVG